MLKLVRVCMAALLTVVACDVSINIVQLITTTPVAAANKPQSFCTQCRMWLQPSLVCVLLHNT